MTGPKGVQTVPKDNWIALELALSWICFDEAFDLETLCDVLPIMGLSEDEAIDLCEGAWRELADFCSTNGLIVRGRRRHRETASQSERLSADDLYNCRFVDFDRPRHAMLVSRFDRSKEGIWQSVVDPAGADFTHIVVRRDDLLKFKGRARPRMVRRRASRANGLAALESLRRYISERPATEIRREPLMRELCERFGITQKTASDCWKQATENRPDLRAPGRRKGVRGKIRSE
jgi:hypothetical protein